MLSIFRSTGTSTNLIQVRKSCSRTIQVILDFRLTKDHIRQAENTNRTPIIISIWNHVVRIFHGSYILHILGRIIRNRYPLFRNHVMETVIRLIIPFCISRIIIIKELTAWIFFVITTPKRKGYAIILPTPRYFRMIRRTKVTGNLGSIISRFMQ